MPYEDIPLVDRPEIHNFEFVVNGHRAFVDYILKGDKYYLVHTEVPEELGGQGVAPAMVEKVFEYLEHHNRKAVAICPYIRVFLKRHPEWNDKVIAGEDKDV